MRWSSTSETLVPTFRHANRLAAGVVTASLACGKKLLPFLFRARGEGASGAIPKGAQAVPVLRLRPDTQEMPPMPAGMPMLVCFWPSRVEGRSRPIDQQFVLLRTDEGAVIQRRVWLAAEFGPPWWFLPLVPVALAADIVTFPLQAFVAVVVVSVAGES